MNAFRLCAVIPTFNHHLVLSDIIARFAAQDVPVIIVDDGSGPEAAERITFACHGVAAAECLRHETNQGKGAAVVSGLSRAAERGFSHAIQIDADGQHDMARLDALIAAARDNPEAIVLGQPKFDATIPRSRKFGRWLTHVLVFINTMSFEIKDSMCGFRVYPIAEILPLARGEVSGRHMEFDPEILVRSHWRGIPFVRIPVDVTYPAENLSNFDLRRDNARIAAMHARSFFGMLARSPRLLARNISSARRRERQSDHWSDIRERGAYWGLRFVAAVYRFLGRRICLGVLLVPVLYFLLTGRKQRQASASYLKRAWKAGFLRHKPNLFTSFRHFMAFASAALDKFAAWTGNLSDDDLDIISSNLIAQALKDERGAFVITAHLGNPEAIRAVGTADGWRINVFVHTVHAERFNRLIEAFSPESATRMIQVTNLGPETAVTMSEAVERGEWVVMVGDRIAVSEEGGRVAWIPFLGELAPFPVGPYVLASLLKCPTYFLFSLRHGDRYRVHFHKLTDRVVLPRRNRNEALESYAREFVRALEHHTKQAPLQWFNFYDFWRPAGLVPPTASKDEQAPEGARQ